MADYFNGLPPLGFAYWKTDEPGSGVVEAPKPLKLDKRYSFPPESVGVAGTAVTPAVFPKLAFDGTPYNRESCTQHYFNGGQNFVVVDGSIPFNLREFEVKERVLNTDAAFQKAVDEPTADETVAPEQAFIDKLPPVPVSEDITPLSKRPGRG